MVQTHTVGDRELLRLNKMIKKRSFAITEPINWMVCFDDAILNS
jgi:hypothetical protein